MKKKVAFVTCVQLGLSCIEEIYRIGGELDLLITLKDEKAKKKSGRIYLDETASNYDTPLLKIDNINDIEVLDALKKHEIDWLFIIGWSQIAKIDVLEAPSKGCIGMHPTLLPKGRGRAAIPWAILKGLDRTGVTMFKLDEGVDTGEIIGQGIINLNESTTATNLYEDVNRMHVDLISKYWEDIITDRVSLTKQDDTQATEWPGRTAKDGEVTSEMTMDEAEKLVRAVTHPYPGAFYVKDNKKTIIWSAKVDKENGSIKLVDGYLEPIDFEVETINEEQ
ncbi:methionyl-tRNA formyltransferase [Propionigenium maris DSM 9537]|uniref:Methionyl-tRNA formyltransferase n=1 Tax=Propionigenium maris DSM 9537 TaxID=1123000 RepID=A0A9W6LN26_9FUSO|nr:formyltransferase family protein [Propionigenium maris]GLI56911.1 methionyl-tRNA formyltransferase [Propionigenium maris DSM 9537]